MSFENPDYQDIDLTLKLYELRREPVMRQSRETLLTKFWPKSYDDFLQITDMAHPMNAAYRQVSSYWEMVYGFARNGIANPDFLVENNGEGIFLWAKVHSFIPQWRKESSYPYSFQNAEWIVHNSEIGKKRFEMMRLRVQQRLQKM